MTIKFYTRFSALQKTGQVATALVREFLTFFELDYTQSVFDPETNAVSNQLYYKVV